MSCTILQINIYGPSQHDQSIIVSCNKCKNINTHSFGSSEQGRCNARLIKHKDDVDGEMVITKYKSLDFRNLGKRVCDNINCDANYYLYTK